jgi:hypothetical protein
MILAGSEEADQQRSQTSEINSRLSARKIDIARVDKIGAQHQAVDDLLRDHG